MRDLLCVVSPSLQYCYKENIGRSSWKTDQQIGRVYVRSTKPSFGRRTSDGLHPPLHLIHNCPLLSSHTDAIHFRRPNCGPKQTFFSSNLAKMGLQHTTNSTDHQCISLLCLVATKQLRNFAPTKSEYRLGTHIGQKWFQNHLSHVGFECGQK